MSDQSGKNRKLMVNVETIIYEQLREASFSTRKSMSRIVNDAVRDHLKRIHRAAERTTAKP